MSGKLQEVKLVIIGPTFGIIVKNLSEFELLIEGSFPSRNLVENLVYLMDLKWRRNGAVFPSINIGKIGDGSCLDEQK